MEAAVRGRGQSRTAVRQALNSAASPDRHGHRRFSVVRSRAAVPKGVLAGAAMIVPVDAKPDQAVLVKQDMAWWYRKDAAEDKSLSQAEAEAKKSKRGWGRIVSRYRRGSGGRGGGNDLRTACRWLHWLASGARMGGNKPRRPDHA